MVKKESKEIILAAARELFFKYGFKKISIEEICTKAGISRKTFYVYFENKLALVKFILDSIFGESLEAFRLIMDNEGLSFAQKMVQLVELKLERAKEMSMEFLTDLFNSKEAEIQSYLHQKMAENQQLNIDFYLNGQACGEIRQDIDVQVLIQMQNSLFDLCSKEGFTSLFSDSQVMTRQVSELFFYGIINKR